MNMTTRMTEGGGNGTAAAAVAERLGCWALRCYEGGILLQLGTAAESLAGHLIK